MVLYHIYEVKVKIHEIKVKYVKGILEVVEDLTPESPAAQIERYLRNLPEEAV
jgi:hypothetical protein